MHCCTVLDAACKDGHRDPSVLCPQVYRTNPLVLYTRSAEGRSLRPTLLLHNGTVGHRLAPVWLWKQPDLC